jgi:hypothetical protein
MSFTSVLVIFTAYKWYILGDVSKMFNSPSFFKREEAHPQLLTIPIIIHSHPFLPEDRSQLYIRNIGYTAHMA